MPLKEKILAVTIALAVLSAVLIGCNPKAKTLAVQNTPAGPETIAAKNEEPLAPEAHPVGGIPDNQVFATYSSPAGGYQLQVPEGWARTTTGTDVSFVDKYDGASVSITVMAPTSSLDQEEIGQASALKESGKAVQVKQVSRVRIAGGPAILMVYESNSAPGPVTNKEVRLENDRYLISNNDMLAVVTLWAPLGTDNADQWNLIANSFGWL